MPPAVPPAIPADRLAELPTPCLVVDLEAADRNIQRMAEYFANRSVKLRPHFKAHKCSQLLRRQLQAGSCSGVTCATAAEALILARQGIQDVLVANQVLDRPGLAQLAQAAALVRVSVAVDHPAQVQALQDTLAASPTRLGVLVEVDVGAHRCGLAAGDPLLIQLARQVQAAPSLRFEGLLGYEGHAVLRPDREERRTLVAEAAAILKSERARLETAGIACPIVSGGGTGTYDLASEAGALTEIEAGSYVLMDARYGQLDLPFENALYCCATVLSHARADVAVVNAGLKALTVEYGLPVAVRPGLEVLTLADEHARLGVAPGTPVLVGEPLLLVPAHIDPAINLHDALFAWDAELQSFSPFPVDARRQNA